MLYIQLLQPLWPVQGIQITFSLSADETAKLISSSESGLNTGYNHLEITKLEDRSYTFEIISRKSHVIAIGKIIPTSATTCYLSGDVGIVWKQVLIEIIVASVIGIGILAIMIFKDTFDIGRLAKASSILIIPAFSIGCLADWGKIRALTKAFDNLR